jgi:hypothetical protein
MYVSAYCYMCPHTAACVRKVVYRHSKSERIVIYVSAYCFICVRILRYMCPHTAAYLSSYSYVCVRILPYRLSNVAASAVAGADVAMLTYADVC